ncbi:MAG: hypothetical protein ACTSVU_06020 [Promethearchaeota archaeon]
MNWWTRFGWCLFIIPLAIALLIFLTNIGTNGLWPLAVILFILIAIVMLIPSAIMWIIGAKRKKKKRLRDEEDSDFNFQSYMDDKE